MSKLQEEKSLTLWFYLGAIAATVGVAALLLQLMNLR